MHLLNSQIINRYAAPEIRRGASTAALLPQFQSTVSVTKAAWLWLIEQSGVNAFVSVGVGPDLYTIFRNMIACVGLGALVPNTIVLPYQEPWYDVRSNNPTPNRNRNRTPRASVCAHVTSILERYAYRSETCDSNPLAEHHVCRSGPGARFCHSDRQPVERKCQQQGGLRGDHTVLPQRCHVQRVQPAGSSQLVAASRGFCRIRETAPGVFVVSESPPSLLCYFVGSPWSPACNLGSTCTI